MANLESQDLNMGKVFDDFYAIPNYQREYVWEQDRVTDFFEDIYNEFSTGNTKLEYFMGSIIVCEMEGGLYEVIDGQQRITTAYLFLCAIRDRLHEIGSAESIEKLKDKISSTDIDEEGNNVFRYRVSLQYKDSCGVLEKIAKGGNLSKIPKTSSAQKIKSAYQTIKDKLEDIGGDNEAISQIRKLYAYFDKSVILVRVSTSSRADALKLFATINNRGVHLNQVDLLKNLMFMEASPDDFDLLKDTWKETMDLIYKHKQNPLKFIQYFILANYADSHISEKQVYNWLLEKENKKFYTERPVDFVQKIKGAAVNYIQFMQGKNSDGTDNYYLSNIRTLSRTATLPFIVIMAGQDLKKDDFLELCRQMENISFVYFLLNKHTQNPFNRTITQWCTEVRKIKTRSHLDRFIQNNILLEKKKLSSLFQKTFVELEFPPNKQKQKRNYILAKLTQYIEQLAYGVNTANANIEIFINSSDVEHILPQKISQAVKSSFDKPEEIELYINRLGNLTLLEKSHNKSAKNKIFKDKLDYYLESNFLLTESIARNKKVGKNTSIDRAASRLITFKEWTSLSIEQRQEMLTELAFEVWDMPHLEGEP